MSCVDFMLNGAQCRKTNVPRSEENSFDCLNLDLKNLMNDFSEEKPTIEQRGIKRGHPGIFFEPLAPFSKLIKTDSVDENVFNDNFGDETNLYNDPGYSEQATYHQLGDYHEPTLPAQLAPEFVESHFLVPHQVAEVDQPEKIVVDEEKPIVVKNKIVKRTIAKAKRTRVLDREKTVLHYDHIVGLGLINSPQEMATTGMLYTFAEYHFPDITVSSSWKNTLRHALSEKYGFYKVEKTANGKASFWTFIPECRDDVIKEIYDKVNENQHSMEKLKMRNIADLPSLLSGKGGLPNLATIYRMPVPNLKKEQSINIYQETKPVVYKNSCPVYNNWNYHQSPPSFGRNYSNQYEPAHQPQQYQNYVDVNRVYEAPVYNNVQHVQYYQTPQEPQPEYFNL